MGDFPTKKNKMLLEALLSSIKEHALRLGDDAKFQIIFNAETGSRFLQVLRSTVPESYLSKESKAFVNERLCDLKNEEKK